MTTQIRDTAVEASPTRLRLILGASIVMEMLERSRDVNPADGILASLKNSSKP